MSNEGSLLGYDLLAIGMARQTSHTMGQCKTTNSQQLAKNDWTNIWYVKHIYIYIQGENRKCKNSL